MHPHGGIWLLELKKFSSDNLIQTDDERWLKFFRDGEYLDDEHLPEWMRTQTMRQAMSTLKTFSEKEREYFHYMSRLESLREQRSEEKRLQRLVNAEAELQALQSEHQTVQSEYQAVQLEYQAEQQRRVEAERQRAEADQLRVLAEQREAELRAELELLRRGTHASH